jgi:hypothetical protein
MTPSPFRVRSSRPHLGLRPQSQQFAGRTGHRLAPPDPRRRDARVLGQGGLHGAVADAAVVRADILDFVRARTRCSSPSSPLACTVHITTRAAAPKVSDPVTRSTGSCPTPALVKCEMPITTASRMLARSTRGCSAHLTSPLLCESSLTTETTGSTTSSRTASIATACADSWARPRCGSKGLALAGDAGAVDGGDARRVRAHGEEARQQRVGGVVLSTPHQRMARLAP